MFAVTATGLAKFTCCQPEAVSLLKVARREQRAAGAPEVADVGAGVAAPL